MRKWEILEIDSFLHNYPGMMISPTKNNKIILLGKFSFSAMPENGENIDDFYEIEITITENYPNELPYVKEIGGRIPRTLNFHVFPKKETLCMGSPLRLMIQINKNPSLNGFVHICLIPYLYSVSIKIKYGDDFPFGKLDHNREAVLYDYADLLGLETKEQVIETLKLLGMKKRIANKLKCPCNCSKRLSSCHFHSKILELRKIVHSSWYKRHLSFLLKKGGKS